MKTSEIQNVPVIDGHIDLPWQYFKRANLDESAIDFRSNLLHLEPPMQTDLPRLKAGGAKGAFWAVYVPLSTTGEAMVRDARRQIEFVHRLCSRHEESMALVRSADEVEQAWADGRFASLIGIEGGQLINNSLDILRDYAMMGARYLTLTYTVNTDWADSATDTPCHGGLTRFGREVVRELNRLGMMADLAHVSPETMHAALDESKAPVIVSHSCARALVDHPRNVPDDVLRRIARNGGVVMCAFAPFFVNAAACAHYFECEQVRHHLRDRYGGNSAEYRKEWDEWLKDHPAPQASIDDVADHIEHIRRVAGADHVGIGSDFEGFGPGPRGLEDVSCYPALLALLRRRGWPEKDIIKLAHGNILRVMRAVEAAAGPAS